jgi:hypothetical protein
MPLLDTPDKHMIQVGKVSLEPSHPQVDHPNDGICQFETSRGRTCGEICAFTGRHHECRCGSHLYGQFNRGTNHQV